MFLRHGHASAVFSSLAMTYAADTIYTHRSYHRRVQVLKGKRGRSCFVGVNLVSGRSEAEFLVELLHVFPFHDWSLRNARRWRLLGPILFYFENMAGALSLV